MSMMVMKDASPEMTFKVKSFIMKKAILFDKDLKKKYLNLYQDMADSHDVTVLGEIQLICD